jgi:MOSC domain-containing protein YiiM
VEHGNGGKAVGRRKHRPLRFCSPRIPCRTFAGWLGQRGWVKTFTERAVPGAYLRVIEPGFVEAGNPVRVIQRPSHDVTIGLVFRALTTEPELLPRLQAATALHPEAMERVRRREPIELDDANA